MVSFSKLALLLLLSPLLARAQSAVDPTVLAGIQQSAAQQGALLGMQSSNAEAILQMQQFNNDFMTQQARMQDTYINNAKNVAEVADQQGKQLEDTMLQNQVLAQARAMLKKNLDSAPQAQLDALKLAQDSSIVPVSPVPLLQYNNPYNQPQQQQQQPQYQYQTNGNIGMYMTQQGPPQPQGQQTQPQYVSQQPAYQQLTPTYQAGVSYQPNPVLTTPQTLFAQPQYQQQPLYQTMAMAQPNAVQSQASQSLIDENSALRQQLQSYQTAAMNNPGKNTWASTNSLKAIPTRMSLANMLQGAAEIESAVAADDEQTGDDKQTEAEVDEAEVDSVEGLPVLLSENGSDAGDCPDGPHVHVNVRVNVADSSARRLKQRLFDNASRNAQ